MGFFDKLRKSIPGNPTSVAKTMLNVYTSYLDQNPGASRADALRYCIESRYQIIKKMDKYEIEKCLAEADSLGHLVFLCIAKESPLRTKYPHMKETVENLYKFFEEHAPDEIGDLQKLKDLVSI
ncbi:MAG: hypothetical protein ABII26_11090 [Pseudomonadota bacterium]